MDVFAEQYQAVVVEVGQSSKQMYSSNIRPHVHT